MTIEFSPDTGRFRFCAPGVAEAEGVLRIRTGEGSYDSGELQWSATGQQRCKAEGGCGRLEAGTADGVLEIVLTAAECGCRLIQAELVFAPGDFSPPLLAAHSLMQTRGKVPLEFARLTLADRNAANSDVPASHTYAVYARLAQDHACTQGALLIGSLGDSDAFCSFTNLYADPHRQGAFGWRIGLECGCVLPAGASKKLARLIFLVGTDVLGVCEEYGRCWAEERPPLPAQRVLGWNSWDYYGGAVNEAAVRENARAMRDCLPEFRHVILDDGWQVRWGEWEGAHTRFPDGMSGAAAEIRHAGGIPGIWIAPLTMYCHCSFARENRECLLHDAAGNIVIRPFSSGPSVLLDPTHPQVRRYLTEAFSRLYAEGYRYFKIDFTQALLDEQAVVWHEASLTRRNMLESALAAMRQGAQDAYLVCGTFPLEMLAGRVAAARAANDIHTFWSHVKNSAWQLAGNWWMHGRLFRNDPDFLVVRSAGNSGCDPEINYINTGKGRPLEKDEWWVRGAPATPAELEVWATLVALSGGDIICGDRLAVLDESARRTLRLAYEFSSAEAARPVSLVEDALAEQPPALWSAGEAEEERIAVINWGERPLQHIIGGQNARYCEVWSGKEYAAGQTVPLAPHSVLFLRGH